MNENAAMSKGRFLVSHVSRIKLKNFSNLQKYLDAN